jgi:hypothetical protein
VDEATRDDLAEVLQSLMQETAARPTFVAA